MSSGLVQDGDVITVAATGGCTQGQIWKGTEVCGVFLETYAASASNTAVPVAVEGVFSVPKKAGATLDFAVGEMAYSLTTGGTERAVATGSTVPIGYAVVAAATGATSVTVKLSR